jgi:hypothetical protein
MKNMEKIVADELLRAVVDKAIREALILRQRAARERISHTLFGNKTAVGLEEGANACCEILYKAFGVMSHGIIETIKRIAAENKSPYLGNDNQDYIALFTTEYREPF